MFPREASRKTENPSLFSSLEEQPVGALAAAWSFAERFWEMNVGLFGVCGLFPTHNPAHKGLRLI
jgi:hypothetical protein